MLVLALACLTASAHSSPFLTRDQNPFVLIYGQPLPTPARLPAAGELKYALSLDIANTLNIEDNASESLYVDFESYNLTLGGIYGLNQRWALKLDIPFIYRSGGVFDHAIDEWHKLFQLPRGNRPNVENDQFRLSYTSSGTTAIDTSTSQSGIADTQLGLGYSLLQDTENAVSLWASVDIPAGSSDELTGNDDLDYAMWLAASGKIGERSMLDTNIGVVLPGDSALAGMDSEDMVIFGHAGAQLALNRTLALKLQLAGHSGYYKNTSMDFLGSAIILIFGGSVNTGKCSAIDVGFSEDIKAGASPDIGLIVSWKSSLGNCS